MQAEFGYGTRRLSGDNPGADEVGIVSIGGSLAGMEGKFSTTGPLTIESFLVMNLGYIEFDAGDGGVFVDEARLVTRVFPIHGPVRPYIGFGMGLGLYMETTDTETTSDTEMGLGLGIGVLGSVGIEVGTPEKFMLSVEASYLANSATDYGGSQVTVSLVFKQ